jgi:hypothetical protein
MIFDKATIERVEGATVTAKVERGERCHEASLGIGFVEYKFAVSWPTPNPPIKELSTVCQKRFTGRLTK